MKVERPWRERLRGKLPALSVRWRLTLWYLMILSLVMLVFGGLIYETQATSIRSQLNDDLRRQSDQIAASFDPTTQQFDRGGAETEPATPKAVDAEEEAKLATAKSNGIFPETTTIVSTTPKVLGPGVVAVLLGVTQQVLIRYGDLTDADLKRLSSEVVVIAPPHAGNSSFTDTLSVPHGTSTQTEQYRFYTTPILAKDTLFGTLVVGVPDRAPAQLRRLLLTLLLATPITLLLATAGGYWLAARAMRPVRAISNVARTIGETDLSRRLNLANRDELGELAGTFDRMLDRLEGAFQRQRQFTSDASHELRTPLTIVQLELEHALAGGALSPDVARALKTIQSENVYMSRLVNDLLTLARADSGRAVIGREPLDLSDLALAVVERLAAFAREKEIVLRVGDLPDVEVVGDPFYLTQMLNNIIENAIRYTSGQGHSVSIEAGARSAGGIPQGWVRVSDDGPGVAAEHLPHLFERFYRVDQSRQRVAGDTGQPVEASGSGLGLSIVKWVATTHGGDVRVTSTPGHGTTVEVWLPLAGEDGHEGLNSTAATVLTRHKHNSEGSYVRPIS
ncbi:MAG TPA: HAMP domain-containing sensor histidine kinase [Nitrolancea sp.]